MPFLASVIGTSVATEGGISCFSSLPSIRRLRIRVAASLEHKQRHRHLEASDADCRHRAIVPGPYGIDYFSSRGPRPAGWCRRSLLRGRNASSTYCRPSCSARLGGERVAPVIYGFAYSLQHTWNTDRDIGFSKRQTLIAAPGYGP